MITIDTIDQKVIKCLQENGRMSIAELSKQVNLSAPAVNERVKKLEEKGVITGYQALVEPTLIGKSITAHILMNTTKCHQFVSFCQEHSEVMECSRLAGQYDYLVKVVTESVTTLEEFINEAMAYGKPSTLIHLSEPVKSKAFYR